MLSTTTYYYTGSVTACLPLSLLSGDHRSSLAYTSGNSVEDNGVGGNDR